MSEIRVTNYRDASFWELVLKECDLKNPEKIKEAKRALRKFYNKPIDNPDTDGRVFNDDGDGFTVLKPYPEDIQTKEDAEEYFREYERIEYRPTYYDFTGQLFTSWHKTFCKPDGRYWMYHRISIDC